jgi:hypothetical protein
MAKPKNFEGSTGGRKGGKQFPNYSLKQILPNLKELTSKTHMKPINIEQLNVGVFKVDAKSSKGKIRFSSLKQFSLAEGTYTALSATELATKIVLAPEAEKNVLIRQSFLNVSTFKDAFETFQGSTTNKSRIKNYAVNSLKVHLDSADKFVDIFLESGDVAQLCTIQGDDITFVNNNELGQIKSENRGDGQDETDEGNTDEISDDQQDDDNTDSQSNHTPPRNKMRNNGHKIELKIDPTLDPEKLEKQLKVLKKFGLI